MDEWEELSKMANEYMGKEKSEELERGAEAVSILLETDADISMTIIILAVRCGRVSVEQAIRTNFLAGAGIYRELMIEAGIDVEAIERKLIDAKKNKQ